MMDDSTSNRSDRLGDNKAWELVGASGNLRACLF